MKRNSLILAAWLAFLLPAGAQEDPKTPPPQDPPKTEGPTFDDLKKSLGEVQEKEAKDEAEKRDRAIHQNHEDTLRIYSGVSAGKGADAANLARRLQANQALEQKYAKSLEGSTSELAAMRAQYINRTMNLKKGLDEGRLSREAYDKLLDEDTKRFRNREKELIEDIAFYNEEIASARKLTKELSVKKELLEFDPFDPDRKDETAKAAGARENMADRLKKTVSELSGYRPRSVLDYLK